MDRLDHFELHDLIGTGGMARVYRARDTRLDREVALKLIDPALASRPHAARRFQREARLAAGLRHPNVVAVFDCSPEGAPQLYIVTELVEGGSLRNRMGNGMLAEEAALLLLPVARALGAAHRHGIIHRDVKPDNILVDRGEAGAVIKLADFGVAVARFEPRVTTDGGISGSLAYLAPEILEGEPVAPSADVWSFGVTFFELVHGRLPFRGALLQAVGKGPIAIDEARVPAPLARLTRGCLQRAPGSRPTDGDELAARLERGLAECGLDQPDQELARWAREPDYAQRLRARLADQLVAEARAATLPARADLLDRALGLMPGHAEALDLLGGNAQPGPAAMPAARSATTDARPRHRGPWLILAALCATALLSAGAALMLSRRSSSASSNAVVPPAVTVSITPDGGVSTARSPGRSDASAPARSMPPPRHVLRPATLQLTTEPWAEVTLDGRPLGHTPKVQRLSLKPGEHRLRLQNPLCRPEQLKLQVKSGELLVRHVRLEVLSAHVTLRGPAGWKVFLDGRPLGAVPLPILNVEHGEHKLRVMSPSGESRERRFRAVAGQNLTLNILDE